MVEQRVFVCRHVFSRSKPVLLVANSAGDLCFLCGEEHEQNVDSFEAVGLNHVLDNDETLQSAIVDLPLNCEIERESVGSPWRQNQILPEELE